MHKQVSDLLDQRDSILSGNHELLASEKAKVDALNDAAKRFKDDAIFVLDENNKRTTKLESDTKLVADSREALEKEKAAYSEEVHRTNNELCVALLNAANTLSEGKHLVAEAGVKMAEYDRCCKSYQESIEVFNLDRDHLEEQRQEVDAKHAEAIELSADARQLISEAKVSNKEADEKLLESKKALEDSRINKKQAQDALAEVVKQKEGINDLIIESKRQKLEAQQSYDASKKALTEANLKIAELNELKAAMAKQES